MGAGVGLLGSKGKKSGNVTTVQSNEPPAFARPFLEQGLQAAGGILNQGFNPQTQAILRARGLFGSPVTNEAQNLAASTLRGDSLNSNPFLDRSIQDTLGLVRSQINSQFAGRGGNDFGSSAHQELLGRGLTAAALPFQFQNFENERGRQFQALAQAPALAGLDIQNLGLLQQADNTPFDFLRQFQQIVGGLTPGLGGTSTTQTPFFTNPVNSAIGGGLLGNQLFNSFNSNQTTGNNSGLGGFSSTPFFQSGFADF